MGHPVECSDYRCSRGTVWGSICMIRKKIKYSVIQKRVTNSDSFYGIFSYYTVAGEAVLITCFVDGR